MNWFKAKGQFSSGIVDGFNNKAKLTTRKAYGFRTFYAAQIYLHSKKSLALLAKENGLHIDKTIYDSAKFQFTGSELYIRDIPLNSDKKTRKIFSKKQLEIFEKRAIELNNSSNGDQAVFYLKSTGF